MTSPTFSPAAIEISRCVIADAPAYRSERRAMLKRRLAAAGIKIQASHWDELLDLGRPVRGSRPS